MGEIESNIASKKQIKLLSLDRLQIVYNFTIFNSHFPIMIITSSRSQQIINS